MGERSHRVSESGNVFYGVSLSAVEPPEVGDRVSHWIRLHRYKGRLQWPETEAGCAKDIFSFTSALVTKILRSSSALMGRRVAER